MSEQHQCPRRVEVPPSANLPEHDIWEGGRCSFCGSLTPEALFEAIEDGQQLTPTDKNYKVYVQGADSANGTGKFYFQHLDDGQKTRFIELLNAKKINFAAPGYFYRLPFFVSVAK